MIWYAVPKTGSYTRPRYEVRGWTHRWSLHGDFVRDRSMPPLDRVVVDSEAGDRIGDRNVVVAHVTSPEAALAVVRLLMTGEEWRMAGSDPDLTPKGT